ncbi:MAG: hypothetical protein ABIP94_08180 [Planctomycetota bacterium]
MSRHVMERTPRMAPRRAGSAGFSLIEVVIASVLLSLMILAVVTLSISGTDAQEYARRLNRATEVTQDLVDQLRLELVSCVRVFGNDAEGNGNVAMIDLAGAPAPLAGLRLPTVSPNALLRVDTVGSQITGNSLLFSKLVWDDRFVCTSSREYLVDVSRWIYYYLAPESGGPAAGSSSGLNIARVVSEPLIDSASIDRITDPVDQAEVLLHMLTQTPDVNGIVHDRCEVVWRRGGDPVAVGTFRQIDDSDGSLSNSPIGSRPSPWSVLRKDGSAVVGRLAYRHHSIATNFSIPAFGVGKYAVTSLLGAGFPHGFEIQVVGPSSARQILLHLVVASTNRRGQVAYSDMQVVVDSRDL